MRIYKLLLLCSILPFWAQAQVPDSVFYESIYDNVSNNSSYLYYPILINKYNSIDSVMNSEEALHLYYGSKFQSFYNPSTEHALMDSLNQCLFFDLGESVDYQAVEDLCLQILADEVINLDVQKTLIYASGMTGNADHNLYLKQYEIINLAITESQNIIDDELSFIVVNKSDINHYIMRNSWEFMGETILTERSESVKLSINGNTVMYNFNIGAQLDHMKYTSITAPD